MQGTEFESVDDVTPARRPRWILRISSVRSVALIAWALAVIAFWLFVCRAEVGPLSYLLGIVDGLSEQPLAAAGLLAFYLLRPLLLVPITVLNLAAGILLGPVLGIVFALIGTLLSASAGYCIGRFFGSPALAERMFHRWPVVSRLSGRSFETIVAGGLMYLHADVVNLPAGLMRIHFPTFLAGIVVGNALMLSTAVFAGASLEGELASARITIDASYFALAASLMAVSFTLAVLVRRHMRFANGSVT